MEIDGTIIRTMLRELACLGFVKDILELTILLRQLSGSRDGRTRGWMDGKGKVSVRIRFTGLDKLGKSDGGDLDGVSSSVRRRRTR